MPYNRDPADATPADRLLEIATILARGVLRLNQTAAESGERDLVDNRLPSAEGCGLRSRNEGD